MAGGAGLGKSAFGKLGRRHRAEKMPSNGTKEEKMTLVVDAVEEVVNISASDIEETPDFGAAIPTDYILGMAKSKGKVKILLDIDQVLSSQELQSLESVGL